MTWYLVWAVWPWAHCFLSLCLSSVLLAGAFHEHVTSSVLRFAILCVMGRVKEKRKWKEYPVSLVCSLELTIYMDKRQTLGQGTGKASSVVRGQPRTSSEAEGDTPLRGRDSWIGPQWLWLCSELPAAISPCCPPPHGWLIPGINIRPKLSQSESFPEIFFFFLFNLGKKIQFPL